LQDDPFFLKSAENRLLLSGHPKIPLQIESPFESVNERTRDCHYEYQQLHHGVVAGIHNGSPEYAHLRIQKGFRFVTVSSDARLIAAGSQQILEKMGHLAKDQKSY